VPTTIHTLRFSVQGWAKLIKKEFRDEYLVLLQNFEIEFDANYLFKWDNLG
jgi:hypothetical protein